ncbi:hypothetical protein E2C01_064963 [Portunus trituberculatus]|uniref:Uncharacterized protein n=1 Tax=Portunus trituberculatus TaxID=210409 RepID=A0A5B7HLS1_PORTR|nr:hypothetical protein [Portunus trituberculatus]
MKRSCCLTTKSITRGTSTTPYTLSAHPSHRDTCNYGGGDMAEQEGNGGGVAVSTRERGARRLAGPGRTRVTLLHPCPPSAPPCPPPPGSPAPDTVTAAATILDLRLWTSVEVPSSPLPLCFFLCDAQTDSAKIRRLTLLVLLQNHASIDKTASH